MSLEQLPIRFGALVDAEPLYQQVLRAVEMLASGIGKGTVAAQLRLTDSTFSNALRDSNRCSLKGLHLVALILLDDADKILELLADAKGKTLHRRRPISDAEKLDRLRSHLCRRLGELGAQIADEALR